MKREVIRVEPLYSYLAKWNAPISSVTRAGNMVFVSGFRLSIRDGRGSPGADRASDRNCA